MKLDDILFSIWAILIIITSINVLINFNSRHDYIQDNYPAISDKIKPKPSTFWSYDILNVIDFYFRPLPATRAAPEINTISKSTRQAPVDERPRFCYHDNLPA